MQTLGIVYIASHSTISSLSLHKYKRCVCVGGDEEGQQRKKVFQGDTMVVTTENAKKREKADPHLSIFCPSKMTMFYACSFMYLLQPFLRIFQ